MMQADVYLPFTSYFCLLTVTPGGGRNSKASAGATKFSCTFVKATSEIAPASSISRTLEILPSTKTSRIISRKPPAAPRGTSRSSRVCDSQPSRPASVIERNCRRRFDWPSRKRKGKRASATDPASARTASRSAGT